MKLVGTLKEYQNNYASFLHPIYEECDNYYIYVNPFYCQLMLFPEEIDFLNTFKSVYVDSRINEDDVVYTIGIEHQILIMGTKEYISNYFITYFDYKYDDDRSRRNNKLSILAKLEEYGRIRDYILKAITFSHLSEEEKNELLSLGDYYCQNDKGKTRIK